MKRVIEEKDLIDITLQVLVKDSEDEDDAAAKAKMERITTYITETTNIFHNDVEISIS